jgi:hypothetical protein
MAHEVEAIATVMRGGALSIMVHVLVTGRSVVRRCVRAITEGMIVLMESRRVMRVGLHADNAGENQGTRQDHAQKASNDRYVLPQAHAYPGWPLETAM